MRPQQPSGTHTISQALHAEAGLGALLARWQHSKRCLTAATPVLGVSLAGAMRPGPLEEGVWVLLASSPASAAKARQLLPRIQKALDDQGLGVTTVRVRVSRSTMQAA
ncbi:MAG: hypothetical protein ACO3ZK_17520 [Rubrivivax sp.]|jgi:hypothetical protein